MKTITKSEDCFSCQNCCKFYLKEEYFAPIFTDKELLSIPLNMRKKAVFTSHKKSNKVFQVKLTSSKKENGILICPFYNEDKQHCKIYPVRPLDCQLWPIILTKSKYKNIVNITIAESTYCPSIDKSITGKMNYYSYIIKYLNSAIFVNKLKKYPEIIWGYESFTEKIGEIDL